MRGGSAVGGAVQGARAATQDWARTARTADLPASSPFAEALRAAFEAALEAGASPLPDNPGALAPLVRRVRFTPSDEPSVPPTYAVEDYRTGQVYERRAGDLQVALQPLHQAILRREGGEG